MSKKACKCTEVECEECPEWIFTLADLIMCMMGLFVILWVLKPEGRAPSPQVVNAVEADQWLETVAGVRSGFGWEPDPTSTDPVDQAIVRKRLRNRGPGEGGKTLAPRAGAEGDNPEVTTIRPGQWATIGGKLVFEPAQAVLSHSARSALDQIAAEIRGHRNIVLVKGHTALDDFPDGTTAQVKMELSLKRAQVAADYLMSQGVADEILRVQGCSTYEPVIQRAYTLDKLALNRRVEVDATDTLVPELQDPPEPAALPATQAAH